MEFIEIVFPDGFGKLIITLRPEGVLKVPFVFVDSEASTGASQIEETLNSLIVPAVTLIGR